jgi:hypothetical protein
MDAKSRRNGISSTFEGNGSNLTMEKPQQRSPSQGSKINITSNYDTVRPGACDMMN